MYVRGAKLNAEFGTLGVSNRAHVRAHEGAGRMNALDPVGATGGVPAGPVSSAVSLKQLQRRCALLDAAAPTDIRSWPEPGELPSGRLHDRRGLQEARTSCALDS